MKNLGQNKKPKEEIPTLVLIIPYGILFGREETKEQNMRNGGPRVKWSPAPLIPSLIAASHKKTATCL